MLEQEQGLTFKKNKGYQLDCYADADFAGLWNYEDSEDPVCVKSRSGYVMTLADCPIHWVSKLQTVIALSTLESEYIYLSQAMRELVPMRRLIKEIIEHLDPKALENETNLVSTIWEDNNGTISTVTAPKLSPRTKHIATKYHFTRSHIGKEIVLKKIESEKQKADIFTKGLNEDKFKALQKLLCGW